MDLTSFISELKSKLNIIEVCERYMTLTQKGGRFWGCCPFHHEKTASFSINEEAGFFYCFGCKESGDVIKFVQQMEGTDFMGAVEVLAKMAGMEVPRFSGSNKDDGEAKRKYKERLLSLTRETAYFYYRNLKTESGVVAREYLANRGISADDVKRFAIGYSIDWEGLPQHLRSLGYSEKEMVDAGVCDIKNNRIYDSLGGRLIIPIIDSFKNVIAFGGRVLGKTDFAKYKNTRETELFYKSKTLFGMNLVKETRKTQKVDELIVVEGYMDAISLYTAGFVGVVASMGTSLTQEQARMMKFLVSKVCISYDGDFAGLKAAVRGLDILESAGIDVKVAVMPEGMDPDDVIKKLGRDEYANILKNALPLVDFKLFILKSEVDLTDALQRRKYTQQALKVISQVKEYSVKSELCERVSREVGVKYQSIVQDLEQITNGELKKQEKEKAQQVQNNPELKKDVTQQEKDFILYMVLSGKASKESIAEIWDNFSGAEQEVMQEYINMKLPLSSLFDYLGARSYDILQCEEVDNKEKYFQDVLKRQKIKLYDKAIALCTTKLKIASTSEEKHKLVKEINKYTKLKKM
ncbi:MAG: DNA primase [Bacillota bacterium]